MHSIVLGTGMRLEIMVIITLHTQYCLHTQYGIQIGILTTGLLSTSPTGITEDVDIWTPEREFGITWIIDDTHGYIEQFRIFVVGAIPVGTSLITDL